MAKLKLQQLQTQLGQPQTAIEQLAAAYKRLTGTDPTPEQLQLATGMAKPSAAAHVDEYKPYTVPGPDGKPAVTYAAQVGNKLLMRNGQELPENAQPYKPPSDKPDTATEDAQRYERIQADTIMKRPVSLEDAAWASAYVKQRTLGPTTAFNLQQGGGISDDAVDMAATIYRITGQMPALGLGGVGLREKILNRAASQAKDSGQAPPKPGETAGADIAASKAGYASQVSALTQLQRTRSAVGAFERTALKNLDLFTNAAKKVVDSGSPWVNYPLRAVSRGALGSEDLAAYDTARRVALTEVARVVNNPNLVGVLTDEGRKEIAQAAGPDANLRMIYSAVNILKRDMENRKNGLDEEIATLAKQLRGGSGSSPTGAPPPGSNVISLDDFLKGK